MKDQHGRVKITKAGRELYASPGFALDRARAAGWVPVEEQIAADRAEASAYVSGATRSLHLTHRLETLQPGQGWDLDDVWSVWHLRHHPRRYALRRPCPEGSIQAEENVSTHRTAAGAVLAWLAAGCSP